MNVLKIKLVLLLILAFGITYSSNIAKNYEPGAYIVQLISDGTMETKQIIIE